MNSLLSDGLRYPEQKAGKVDVEIWKDIPGYESIYEASSLGRIRSAAGKTTSNSIYPVRVWKQRILKQKIRTNGKRRDARVCLWKDGKEKTFLVARLVASTFLGPPNGLTVNHKDGNSLNNCIENLEWLTIEDNAKHAFDTGLCDSFCVKTFLKNVKSGDTKCFRSISEASRWLGRNAGYIYNCKKRNLKIRSSSGEEYNVFYEQRGMQESGVV